VKSIRPRNINTNDIPIFWTSEAIVKFQYRMAEPDNLQTEKVTALLWKLLTAWIMKNRSHSIVLNHLIKSIMEHHQTRWYEVLKIIIGNWVE